MYYFENNGKGKRAKMKMNLWFEQPTDFNKRKHFVNFVYVLVSKGISRYFQNSTRLVIENYWNEANTSCFHYYIELIIFDKLFSLIRSLYLSINSSLDLSYIYRVMKRKWILTRDKIFLVESTNVLFIYIYRNIFVYLSGRRIKQIFFFYRIFFKKKGNFFSIAVKILIQI